MARKDRFLVALGVKCTLSDGSVEQYPRLQQCTFTYRPVYFQRSKRLHTLESVCLDTEGATESDGCSSSLRMDDIHVTVGPGDQSGKHCMIRQMAYRQQQ